MKYNITMALFEIILTVLVLGVLGFLGMIGWILYQSMLKPLKKATEAEVKMVAKEVERAKSTFQHYNVETRMEVKTVEADLDDTTVERLKKLRRK